jgi:26S proteasome regulatory subunit T6
METGSYVGEVVKVMDKKKILVKVHPEGKFVVDIDKNIDVADITANCRVALRCRFQLRSISAEYLGANFTT